MPKTKFTKCYSLNHTNMPLTTNDCHLNKFWSKAQRMHKEPWPVT